jgi:TonB family protein
MQEVIDDIIDRRAHQPEKIGRVVVWSILAHVGLIAFFVYMPASWRGKTDEGPKTVMTISLGGATGPRNGGMTQMGGRTVQEPTPEPVRRAEVPPAAKPPAMTLPTKTVRTVTPPKSAPKEAVGRTPTRGEQPQEGPARAETGARGQGFGLTTGGGGGTGVQLDIGNFCCPEYLEQMIRAIQQNWQSNQGVAGVVVMHFTITRSGSIENIQVVRPSGFVAHELAAQRALLLARLPELPPQYPNATLGLRLSFEYQR